MAEYLFAEIGLSFKLAFDIDLLNRIFHSFDPAFPQAKEESYDLVKVFGGKKEKEELMVVLMLKDGSSFLVNGCQFEKTSEWSKLFPLNPSLFEAENFWARAVLCKKNEIAFTVVPEGLMKVCNG
ncbi:MAG: hypothetical protein ACE14Q_04035 [Acidobacteriota bacterium]